MRKQINKNQTEEKENLEKSRARKNTPDVPKSENQEPPEPRVWETNHKILRWKWKSGSFLTCFGVRFCPARLDKDHWWEPAIVRLHFSLSILRINIFTNNLKNLSGIREVFYTHQGHYIPMPCVLKSVRSGIHIRPGPGMIQKMNSNESSLSVDGNSENRWNSEKNK